MAINKRIVLSFLTIVGVVALVAAIAVAAFSDQASLTGNTLSTGTADLKIAPEAASPGTYEDSITGFDFDDIVPGGSDTFLFWLNNDSGFPMSIEAETSITSDTATDPTLSELVNLTLVCDTDKDTSFADETSVTMTVNAFEGNPTSIDTTLATDTGSTDGTGADEVQCKVTAELDESATNDVAASDLEFDITFTGTQVIP